MNFMPTFHIQRWVLLPSILVLICASFSVVADQATNKTPIEVNQLDLFAAFEHDVNIYKCSIVKLEALDEGRNVNRGKVTLNVIQTLRGTNRQSITLPYSFIPRGGDAIDGYLIWPDLAGVTNILCFVVPWAKDSTTWISGMQEAASKVVVLKNDGLALEEAETLCKLHDTRGTPQDIILIKKCLDSQQPTVRNFALKTTILNLAKAAPEESLEMIRNEAPQNGNFTKQKGVVYDPLNQDSGGPLLIYEGGGHGPEEAKSIIHFIQVKFKYSKSSEEMDKFLFRCLIALAQSPLKEIADESVAALAKCASGTSELPNYRLQDDLNDSEKNELSRVLNTKLKSDNPKTVDDARKLREWLEK
jgi:hypothetical protein